MQPHLPLPSTQCASLSPRHHPPWLPGLVLQGPTSWARPQTPSGGAAAHWGPSWSVEAAVSENSPPPARAQPVCWCAAAPTPASALGSGFRPPGGELPTCSWGSQWWEGPWPRGGPTTGEDAVRATGTGWERPWALCRPTWLACVSCGQRRVPWWALLPSWGRGRAGAGLSSGFSLKMARAAGVGRQVRGQHAIQTTGARAAGARTPRAVFGPTSPLWPEKAPAGYRAVGESLPTLASLTPVDTRPGCGRRDREDTKQGGHVQLSIQAPATWAQAALPFCRVTGAPRDPGGRRGSEGGGLKALGPGPAPPARQLPAAHRACLGTLP